MSTIYINGLPVTVRQLGSSWVASIGEPRAEVHLTESSEFRVASAVVSQLSHAAKRAA